MTKKDKKNNRKQIDKCLITDFIAVTKYSDPNQSFKVYQEKRKEGKQNVSWTRGVLTEDYPDMKKKDILKLILTQLEEMKTRMGNDMIINWEIKER